MDPVIRPENGLLLIAVQAQEGVAATLDPAVHGVPVERDSVTYNGPFTAEAVGEANGSYVAGAPLVVGQPATFAFRSRLKGANAGYTAAVKPPLHNALLGCGWRGQFTAAIAAAALAAGTAMSATLPAAFAATAQLYRGMPLVISAGAGNGHQPLITDYTAGRVATLSDTFTPPLDATTQAGIPANWTYAGTSPRDAAARLLDHPAVTIGWYEDGNLHTWMDCRGTLDIEGTSARPAIAAFSFSGVYVGSAAAAIPASAVVAQHSAPTLVKGAGQPPAMLANRIQLPIGRFALRSGSGVEMPDDPNTQFGFGAGQLAGRTPMFEADPLRTLVSTRNAIAEIAAASQYSIALRLGAAGAAGNRIGLLLPLAQPVAADNSMRGRLRADAMTYQALSPGRDAQDRDSDRFLTFY
jgi:hypothetical protein